MTYLLNVIHCPNTRKIMRAALGKGWEWVGYTKGGHVEIRWPATDAVLHCATTPSDPNSWKQFARQITRVSGVEVWRKGNRRRSRKAMNGPDKSLEAARRRYAEQQRRHLANEERRAAAATRTRAAEQHQREIEALMRPGYGR